MGRAASHTMCQVFRSDKATVVTTPAPPTILAATPLADLILTLATDTAMILVLTARHTSELKSDDDNTTTTHCLATDKVRSPPPCPTLPSPNILSGLAAAVLTLCQVQLVPSTVITHLVPGE